MLYTRLETQTFNSTQTRDRSRIRVELLYREHASLTLKMTNITSASVLEQMETIEAFLVLPALETFSITRSIDKKIGNQNITNMEKTKKGGK